MNVNSNYLTLVSCDPALKLNFVQKRDPAADFDLIIKVIEDDNLAGLQKLIDCGVDINWQNSERLSPLIFAIQKENVPLVTCLLDNHADVHARYENGSQPILFAAEIGNIQIIELLLENHADFFSINNEGWGVLHFVACSKKVETCKFLLDNGALPMINKQVYLKPGFVVTPLMLAALEGALDIMTLLYECGADLLARNKTDFLPIHYAALANQGDVVRWLLAKKTSQALMVDNACQTPAMIALSGGFQELAEEIKKYDSGKSDYLFQLKLFVHRFSLDKTYETEHGTVTLHRCHRTSFHKNLLESLAAFKDQYDFSTSNFKAEDWENLPKIIKDGNKNSGYDAPPIDQNTKFIWAKSLDFPSHACSVVTDGKYLLKGDRGGILNGTGIEVYRIENPSESQRAFKILAPLGKPPNEEAKKYFLTRINVDLHLKLLMIIFQTKQKSSTCAWASGLKPMVRGIILLKALQNINVVGDELYLSRKIYKAWTAFDRLWGIKNFINFFKTHPHEVYTPIAEELINDLFIKYQKGQHPEVVKYLNDNGYHLNAKHKPLTKVKI